jgi:hypothetical protein
MTDDWIGDDEATPEERAETDRKAAKVRKMIRDLEEAGWQWDSVANMLTHPGDSEVNMWIDPDSYDVWYSLKLGELLKRQGDYESQGGEP